MSASTGSVAGPARLWPQRLRFLPPALNHYLNATSSLTSPKANTQTETMLPRSQPPKALLDLPSSPAKRGGVEGSGSATGHRPLPGLAFAKVDFSPPPPICPLFVPTKNKSGPSPVPRKNPRRTPRNQDLLIVENVIPSPQPCHSEPPAVSFRTPSHVIPSP